MKKRILLASIALIAMAVGVVGMSAFEAHVINVTAKIENALSVAQEHIDFGTVFPQETLYRSLDIALSQSFSDEERANDVQYVIKSKPKVIGGDPYAIIKPIKYPNGISAHVYCLENVPTSYNAVDEYWDYCYPNLSAMLSCHKDPSEANEYGTEVDAPNNSWETNWATGYLSKSDNDTSDHWLVDLVVPGFEGMIDQAYTDTVYGALLDPNLEHKVFGSDLWIEVTGISRSVLLREELGDSTELPGPVIGKLYYDDEGSTFQATVKVDDGYFAGRQIDDHKFILVLNGPRNGAVGVGSANELLATYACLNPTPGLNQGWDGWWTRQSDNTGSTKCVLDPTDTPLEGYYNFEFDVTASELEAGKTINLPLTAGEYYEVQFLVKDADDDWKTVVEHPAIGEGEFSELNFTVTN